jgi:hypothetical protein
VTQRLVLALVVNLLGVSADAGERPRDELLRLVPNNTAICLVVTNLREQAAAVADSPFAAWASKSFGQKVTGTAEYNTLKQLEAFIASQIGIGYVDVRDDILGDAIVFAYQPGPSDKPDAETGVVLLKARDPIKLRTLIDKLNQLQLASNELQAISDEQHQGVGYVRRKKSDGLDEFYLLRDGLFAFSGQESALKQVIDRFGKPGNESPALNQLRRSDANDAFIAVWINPRQLDATLKAKTDAEGDTGRRAFLTQFGRVWAATDGVVVRLNVSKHIDLGLNWSFEPEKLPVEIRSLLSSPTRSSVWDAIPQDAMFAVGGRIDPVAVVKAISSFLPAEERGQIRTAITNTIGPVIGKQNVDTFLDNLGPEFGFWAERPKSSSQHWFPQLTAAVRVRSVPAKRWAMQAGNFWLQMVQVDYNKRHDDQIDLHDDTSGDIAVKCLTGTATFPSGVSPGFAINGNHIVAGSSPAVVRSFRHFDLPKPINDQEIPLVRVSAVVVQKYLHDQQKELAGWLARAQNRPEVEIEPELKTLSTILEPVECAEVLIRSNRSTFGLSLRLTMVKPLAK